MKRGQALIGVLLVLTVVMTVVLSIASRSTTDVSVSTAQEEGARALTAAEAGIEAELGGIDSPNATSGPYGTGSEVVLEEPLAAGEVGTIFLSDTSGNTFKLCWGQGPNDTNAPAIEVMLYYKDSGGAYKVSRNAYDAVSRGNGFYTASYTAGGDTGCLPGKIYVFSKSVVLSADVNGGGLGMPLSYTPMFLRLRLLYNGANKHYVGVKDTNGTFPSQGQVISSVGQVGDVSRTVQAFQPYGDAWPILDSAVFSASSL